MFSLCFLLCLVCYVLLYVDVVCYLVYLYFNLLFEVWGYYFGE